MWYCGGSLWGTNTGLSTEFPFTLFTEVLDIAGGWTLSHSYLNFSILLSAGKEILDSLQQASDFPRMFLCLTVTCKEQQ